MVYILFRDLQLKKYPIVGAQGLAPLQINFGFSIIYFLVFPYTAHGSACGFNCCNYFTHRILRDLSNQVPL